MRVPVPVLVLLLGGCGRDYCERSADLVADCDGAEPSEADVDACREQLEPCNHDDRKLLDDSLDCAIEQDLFTCDESEATATATTGELGAIFACFLPLAALSSECQESAGGFDLETTFSTSQ